MRVRPVDFPLLFSSLHFPSSSLVSVIELSQFADFFQLASLLNVHLHWPKSLSYRTHLSLSLSLARSFLFILISPTFICAGGGRKRRGRRERGGKKGRREGWLFRTVMCTNYLRGIMDHGKTRRGGG